MNLNLKLNAPSGMNYKTMSIPLKLCLALLIIGIVFKVLHLPGSLLLIIASSGLILILYMIRFANKENKVFSDFLKVFLITSIIINGIFTFLHLPYKSIFQVISFLTVITWIIWELIQYCISDKSQNQSNEKKSKVIYLITTTLIITGTFFKIMHWPFASVLLLSGLFICVVIFIKELVDAK